MADRVGSVTNYRLTYPHKLKSPTVLKETWESRPSDRIHFRIHYCDLGVKAMQEDNDTWVLYVAQLTVWTESGQCQRVAWSWE